MYCTITMKRLHRYTHTGFSVEFCTVAVVVTGVTLIYIYYTSTGRSTLTAVTLTCDTSDRCYVRVTGSTENPDIHAQYVLFSEDCEL